MQTVMFSQIKVDDLLSQLRNEVKIAIREHAEEQQKEQLLSPSQVCALFKPTISKSTLSKYTKQRKLTAYRLCGKVLYKYGEVMKDIERITKYERTLIPA